ncbi:division/cell wall cluster transcriptional repressor MraZ [Psychrosphaera aquimarina]|uniref:Transcriptional regulator MraZ n=1 Tax=Psychrosphaera aquimarina TaxID=2044854 RepID=A0ABU3QYV7_9GAMM|nr:division/cell wall cluster transcriptional repressor MraZ [Psychrosphaera aquimarina]MDU0112621.1 division/cell wall cluster transcriptional repressor MraZ [Psychrosphaera aquimarina]
MSQVTKKVDAKGRVSVPSAFRTVLTRLDIRDLYVFQDFVFPAISIAGPEVLERFERHIDQGDPFSMEANKMSLLIHGGGVFMKLDGEGRLVVSDFIRDFAGITDQVTFVGRGDYFQLWEPSALSRMQDETRRERMEQSVRST